MNRTPSKIRGITRCLSSEKNSVASEKCEDEFENGVIQEEYTIPIPRTIKPGYSKTMNSSPVRTMHSTSPMHSDFDQGFMKNGLMNL